jgi:hypothetical protein
MVRGLPEVQTEISTMTLENQKSVKAKKYYSPRVFCFTQNYSETIAFIYQLRWRLFGPAAKFNSRDKFRTKRRVQSPTTGSTNQRSMPLSIARGNSIFSLAKTEDFRLDALLVLIAEYDRYRRYVGFRPFIDDSDWPEHLKNAISELGFYDLVEAKGRQNGVGKGSPARSDQRFKWVKFECGENVSMQDATKLVDSLTEAAGNGSINVDIYNSLAEAITNSCMHAYPADEKHQLAPFRKSWWVAGAYDCKDNELNLLAYDQGIGIPRTLPKRESFIPILDFLRSEGVTERTDADVIAGSIEYGRTSTDNPKHGNGMRQICDLVDRLKGSSLKIISGKGQVTYKGPNSVIKNNLSHEFSGTLIWWRLNLPTAGA